MKPFALAVAIITATVLLSGCAQSVALQPATDATNVGCASIVVRLPDSVSGRLVDQLKRETNAQGTGAYGTPDSVLVRCGVEPPAPTAALPCVLVGDVYWLRDATDEPTYIFTTYGREPATEVVIDSTYATPGVVLYDLEGAVAQSTVVGGCTEIEDSLGTTSTAEPTATPSSDPTPTVAP
jgi:hypothetical protein